MTRTPPRTIAIASGKGGVGKTWFAVTLAHALARRGRRVLLLDGDLGLANVDVQLGLLPEVDLGAVMEGTARLSDAIRHYGPGGFEIVAGRSGCGDLASIGAPQVDLLLQQLAAAAPARDHVLIDLGAGLSRAVRRMAAWAEALIVIATEEPTSVTDAYATLKLHAADGSTGNTRLVINQADTARSGERIAEKLTRACATFLGRVPQMAGTIRRDPHVPESIRRQALILQRFPLSPAAEDLERIAAKL